MKTNEDLIATTDNGNNNNIFTHPAFGKLRTWKDPETGQPWFVARDVAMALGYAEKSLNNIGVLFGHVPSQWVSPKLIMGDRGYRTALTVSREGLLFFLGRSDKPKAQPYQHWIAGEVVPQIMNTGGYIPVKAEDDDLTIMSKAMMIMQRTVQQQNALLAARETTIRDQETAITVMQPKAAVYDAHVAPDTSLLVYEFVRTLDGVNSLAVPKTLMDLGYFYRARSQYRVRGRYRERYFREKYSPQYGAVSILVLDKGKQLLTRLYTEGRLPMKKNFSKKQNELQISA